MLPVQCKILFVPAKLSDLCVYACHSLLSIFQFRNFAQTVRVFFAQLPPQPIFINIQIYFDLHLILTLLTLQPQDADAFWHQESEETRRFPLSFPGIAVAVRIFTAFSSIIAC